MPETIHLAQTIALPASLPVQVDRLLAETVAPLIRLLRAETGLSTRLLWENAGGHLFWTLSEIRRGSPERAGEVAEALRALRWPREACSALTLMRTDAIAGSEPPRRRVCCLRHAVPGSVHCAGICPLLQREARDG